MRRSIQDEFPGLKPYVDGDGIAGYRWDHIARMMSQDELERFKKWMNGQTMSIAYDGEMLVYADDLFRWVNKLPVVD